ncbi:endo-1,4-beta-xylanase [Olleya sp. HaHaR_3_96]|uniref:endo-1,4-beta-xylanase n=1 Tax=Olleya sp. HaHaR_3_96 TaxID=2745560 RepID=UPI001C4E5E07|nr:endo-1,4-beta-xylanase [Olleya sp. HaHaR_3_96]QXP61127.1 endo-1,4-beta-xylanase [Olleya sp. HaHaR_3_96]
MKKLSVYFKMLSILLFMIYGTVSKAQTLKSVANAKGVYVGNIMGNGFIANNSTQNGNLNSIASAEYNIFVAENAMKMDAVLSNRPANPFNVQISDLNKSNIDKFVNYANSKGMKKRGHALIWYSQAPQWLLNESPSWSAQQIYDFSRTYITALASYTKDSIDEWDVLNEAIDDGGSANYRNAWYSKVNSEANNNGQQGYITYFGSLFSWARAAAPNVKLFYNDYSIEQFGTSKNNFMRNMVKTLKENNTPIDGVGFQSHFKMGSNGMDDSFINQVGRSIDDLATVNLDVAITELDIRLCGSGSDAQQKSAYKRLTKTVLSKPNCNTLLVWGLSDNNSWIPAFFPGCGSATLHNSNYEKKPAYFGVLEGLQELSEVSGPVNSDDVSSITAPNSVIQGATVTVDVSYSSSENRDILVVFQLNQAPWTVYSSVKKDVVAGTGILNFDIEIPDNAPVADNSYQFQVFITTNNGDWNAKLDSQAKENVDVTGIVAQAITNGTYFIKKATANLFINATAASGSTNSVYNTSANSAKWVFTHLGDEEYKVENVAYATSRLEVPNGGVGRGEKVATTVWNGNRDHLIWKAVKIGANFQFLPKHDQASALDIWEGNNSVHLWDKDAGNANQIFALVGVSSSRASSDLISKKDKKVLNDVRFNVYPNPASDVVSIVLQKGMKGNVSVTNMLGQIVHKGNINKDNGIYKIDVSNYKSGVYIINTAIGFKRFVKK